MKEFRAPVAAMMEVCRTGSDQFTLALTARRTLNGEFCMRMGGKYAVFAPVGNTVHRLPNMDFGNMASWYCFELVRIEDQASCSILCPLDVLI